MFSVLVSRNRLPVLDEDGMAASAQIIMARCFMVSISSGTSSRARASWNHDILHLTTSLPPLGRVYGLVMDTPLTAPTVIVTPFCTSTLLILEIVTLLRYEFAVAVSLPAPDNVVVTPEAKSPLTVSEIVEPASCNPIASPAPSAPR